MTSVNQTLLEDALFVDLNENPFKDIDIATTIATVSFPKPETRLTQKSRYIYEMDVFDLCKNIILCHIYPVGIIGLFAVLIKQVLS